MNLKFWKDQYTKDLEFRINGNRNSIKLIEKLNENASAQEIVKNIGDIEKAHNQLLDFQEKLSNHSFQTTKKRIIIISPCIAIIIAMMTIFNYS